MKRGAAVVVGLFLTGLLGGVALRPIQPWRELAREASDAELEEIVGDSSSAEIARANEFLDAVRTGEAEALRVAARLCRVNQHSAHGSEQLFEALADLLEREPRVALDVVAACEGGVGVLCQFASAGLDRGRLAALRLRLGELADAGAECLEATR